MHESRVGRVVDPFRPSFDLAQEKQSLFEIFERLRKRGIEHEIEVIQDGQAAGSPQVGAVAQMLAKAIEATPGKAAEFEMCPGLLENRFLRSSRNPRV